MPIISKRKLITNVAAYAPAVSAFTPASLTGLVAWYDASIYASLTKVGGGTLASGDQIATWADQSPNGYTLTGGGAAPPLYQSTGFNTTKPTVSWPGDGPRGFVTTTTVNKFNSGTAASLFVVGRINATGLDNGARIAGFAVTGSANDTGGADMIFLFNNGGSLSSYAAGVVGSVAYSTGTDYRFGVALNASDSDIYLNNTATDDVGGGTTFTSTGAIAVGIRQQSNVASDITFSGVMSEVIIGNAVWSAADFTNLYNYAGTKWGL